MKLFNYIIIIIITALCYISGFFIYFTAFLLNV